MGAQPKRKMSHSRSHLRKSQDRAKFGSIVLCSHCRRPHLTHRVCPHCGYYAGREVIAEKPAATQE
jgi:large subunit ribosomal protein L32